MTILRTKALGGASGSKIGIYRFRPIIFFTRPMTQPPKSILYTATGDRGTTSLVGGTRIEKESPRLEAYGSLDELNAHLGVVDSLIDNPEIKASLHAIQNILFDIGAYLATPPDSPYLNPHPADEERIKALERLIDRTDAAVPPARNFVLPGGTQASAQAHVARTVCRRAERRILALSRLEEVAPEVMIFINRLSDYLFALARRLNHDAGKDEILWSKDCRL